MMVDLHRTVFFVRDYGMGSTSPIENTGNENTHHWRQAMTILFGGALSASEAVPGGEGPELGGGGNWEVLD